jgi:predicted nucleic acid-binding protein
MSAMIDKIFIDSNVWCYLFIKEEHEKYKIAEQFISEKANNSIFVISYQVIFTCQNILRIENMVINNIFCKSIKTPNYT